MIIPHNGPWSLRMNDDSHISVHGALAGGKALIWGHARRVEETWQRWHFEQYKTFGRTTMLLECQITKAGEKHCRDIEATLVWCWLKWMKRLRDDKDSNVTPTFLSTSKGHFRNFCHTNIKFYKFRTLFEKIHFWSIHQDFWNTFLS